MSRRGWVAVTVLIAAVVAVAGLPRVLESGPASERPSSQATSTPGGSDAVDREAASEVAGSVVIATPEGRGARSSGGNGLPGIGPDRSTDPLIGASLPRTASRSDGVVAGFPLSVIGLPRGTAVSTSGVSSTAKTLQVSLVADSSRTVPAVLAYYRRSLTALGFVEQAVPAAAGSVAASFVRGKNHLVVTATAGAKRTGYSVFGTLHVDRRS